MKTLLALFPPFIKAVFGVFVFLIGIGWGAYQATSAIAKAEAAQVRDEIKQIRMIDMEHLNKRFDKLEQLIKED